MNLFDNTELGLERAISGAAMRQSVLANNIANANTPGYKRQDVNFQGALAQAMSTGDPQAIESAQFGVTKDPQAVRADGNGVDVDVESSRMAENGLTYQALVSVAKTRIEIIQSAIGSR